MTMQAKRQYIANKIIEKLINLNEMDLLIHSLILDDFEWKIPFY